MVNGEFVAKLATPVTFNSIELLGESAHLEPA